MLTKGILRSIKVSAAGLLFGPCSLSKNAKTKYLVVFRVVALLAALVNPSHILVYAPRDIFVCRLATTRIILANNRDIKSKAKL